METVIAQKGKLRKRFSKSTWELLGDKNGWVLMDETSSAQIVHNIQKKSPPDNGDKKPANQFVNNAAPIEALQVVENTVVETVASEEFKKVVTDNKFSKSALKDKMDIYKIPYKNNLSFDALIDKVAAHFHNDVDQLKNCLFINEL